MKWIIVALPYLLCTVPAVAEEHPKPAAAKTAVGPSQEEIMKAWTAYMTPGREHKLLESYVGTWTGKTKSWMAPGAPPEESESTEVCESILGGRFVMGRFEGKMMGQPFSGIGMTGFDNYKKKWVTTWADSAGTGILTMEGVPDPAGKTISYSGTFDDCVTRKKAKIRARLTLPEGGKYVYEMWMQGPDGKMFRNLEIGYTKN